MKRVCAILLSFHLVSLAAVAVAEEPIRIGTFDVDASPPLGSPMAYDPVKGVQTPLTCRGVVLLGSGRPIVMCAVDWIGIGNRGNLVFREEFAKAVGTTSDRVAVHTLHQHDAPRCDFSAEEIMAAAGHPGVGLDPVFTRDVIHRAASAIRTAVEKAREVKRIGLGKGTIEKVASNRRILGPDGKVVHVRWSATKNAAVREFPEGTIDPEVKLITFYGDKAVPLVALTYYATHPQSYYRTGLANADFPGLARTARQSETGVLHVHFNGAGGNITAGKWNDGAPENRQVLADRMAAGMKQAWNNQKVLPVSAKNLAWNVVSVRLPVSEHLNEQTLVKRIGDSGVPPETRFYDAAKLAWLRRCQSGETVDIGCLTLGSARVLHLPGELFVEYQLAAQKRNPNLFVAMAAYGDYAPGYVGTEIAYTQGGYEAGPGASYVAPQVEQVLTNAIYQLLDK